MILFKTNKKIDEATLSDAACLLWEALEVKNLLTKTECEQILNSKDISPAVDVLTKLGIVDIEDSKIEVDDLFELLRRWQVNSGEASEYIVQLCSENKLAQADRLTQSNNQLAQCAKDLQMILWKFKIKGIKSPF